MTDPSCVISSELKRTVRKFLVRLQDAEDISPEVAKEIDHVLDHIDKLNVCKASKERKPRKPTARNNWIGLCMRKTDNGGMGKGMKDCSTTWEKMSDADKKKYEPKEV